MDFLPVCCEVWEGSQRSRQWLRGQAQRFLSAHTFIYGQGRRQIAHQWHYGHSGQCNGRSLFQLQAGLPTWAAGWKLWKPP